MTLLNGNLVLENANNPGTGTINLGGAPAGRLTFAQQFANGNQAFYFLTDGSQSEWGIGTFIAGSPNQLARTIVKFNTAGTQQPLSFTGACQVYNDEPAEYACSMDQQGSLTVPGEVYIGTAPSSANAAVRLGDFTTAAGIIALPGAIIFQGGSAVTASNGVVTVTYPTPFKSAPYGPFLTITGISNNVSVICGVAAGANSVAFQIVTSTGMGVNTGGIGVLWQAFGR